MTRSIRFAVLFGIVPLFVLTGVALAAKPAEKSDRATTAVEKALRRETIAQLDRRAELKDVLEQQPDSAAARWHAGFVRDGNTWRPVEQIGATAGDTEKLSPYHERRASTPQTASAQFELANWCHQHGLPDQERAHLYAALYLSPNQSSAAVLERLGYSFIGGQWLTRDQLLGWQESNRRAAAALKTWGLRLEKLAFQSTANPQRRDAVRDAMKELNDPDVIGAIEFTLCGRDEPAAALALEMFRQIGGPEGAIAMAKQAVFSKWPGIREKATAELKTGRLEDFVPPLVGLLATPVRQELSGLQLLNLHRRGPVRQFVLISSYILARETEDQFQIAVLKTADYRLNEPIRGMTVNPRRPDSPDRHTSLSFAAARLRGQNDALRFTESEAYSRKKAVDSFNERTEELNVRIVAVLAGVSGRPPANEPKSWWTWWTAHSDTPRQGEKRVVRVEEEEVKGDPTASFMERSSCFAAGTLVTTESGPRAIDAIRPGDRVLAKECDSGELAFKPVVHTTIGPAKELVKLRIGDETIVCTNGHRFWVSGEGWVKARDLKPQSLVHTVTGSVPVWSVSKGPTEPTYNLVVDDFHSYFVGRTGLLVQDLPLPRPTDCVVPGLPRRKLAAASAP